MSFSFASMIRMLALGTVGLTMLAVGVSRLTPPESARRIDAPVTTVSINDHLLGVADHQPRWLDAAGGTIELTPLPGDDVLEAASCSPWVDDGGHRQVIGRWLSRSADGTNSVAHAFGIGRFSFPEGRLIDRFPLENVPVGPPCWLPGDRARVLFVAGDGQLRRFDFEPGGASDEAEGVGTAESRESLVAWDCPRPGAGEVYFGDITWPRLPDARLGDLVVATLRTKLPDPAPGGSLSRSEVWWLRLDASGTRITAAGPLLDRAEGPSGAESGDERAPTIAPLPDGTLGLAFSRAVEGTRSWATCLGTVVIRPDGRPICPEATVRVLDVRGHVGPLAFSPDGRWLNCLVVASRQSAGVRRLPTTGAAVAQLGAATPAP